MPQKLFYPAADRNKQPILEVLKRYLNGSTRGKLLEISSGSGQHVAHIAPHFPSVTFQPTEVDRQLFDSIGTYVSKMNNVKKPEYLDVRERWSSWLGGAVEPGSFDFALNCNMMHIAEWACTEGLFAGCGEVLKPGGLLMTYGPYSIGGVISPESNVRFDASLRSQDPSWGLRDIDSQLKPLAETVGITLKAIHDMPANNKLLVWVKGAPAN